MKERHQDYQLTIPSVPVGGLSDLPLRLDSDAPFALRLVRSRNLGLSGFRFQTPGRRWQSTALRTDLIPQPPGGLANPQPSRGCVVYQQMMYPNNGIIVCEVGNQTNAPLTNVKLLFRGSKIYPDGAINMATYPGKLSPLAFTNPLDVNNVTATLAIQQIPIPVIKDADFVLRYGVCDPFTLGTDGGTFNPFNYSNLYAQLLDENLKPFSNEPIHVNDLFGQGQPKNYQTATSNDDQVLFLPGLFTPEIYIQRNRQFYLNIVRDDAGSGPVNLKFRFQGAKIFAR